MAALDRLAPLWTPHPGQRAFLEADARIKVLACGRRWGKTDACAAEILASLERPSPARHLILAPTRAQAELLFGRTLWLVESLGMPAKVRRHPHPSMKVGDHLVSARSGHVPRSLRGHEATAIVVDEAAYVPESLITEVALPMLAAADGALTLISTPRGRNHFWRFFQMGQRREHGVWSRQAPTRENPHVSASFLEVQRQIISQRAYQVEYEAAFIESAGQVFRSEAVEACLIPSPPKEASPPFSIGVDFARYQDFTAIAVLSGHREGSVLVHLERFQGLDWASLVRRVAAVIQRFPEGRVLCDSTSVGDPLVEQLQSLCPDRLVEGVLFTPALKSELIDGLAWLFEQRALQMAPDPDLLGELERYEASPSPSGRLRLGAAGGHDDLVTALALAARGLPKSWRVRVAVGRPRTFSLASADQTTEP